MNKRDILTLLKGQLEGELQFDSLTKSLYATDASVYRRIPLAVVFPKSINDLKTLIVFASKHAIGLIPRTAGTSLAGQCVGDGIIVDVSKYFTQILSINKDKKTVTVQPGVIRDDLNRFLEPYGLFFGPNTSTSNRCMIGGMVGNNSSGTTSIQYGVTRDKILKMSTVLSDGSEAVFSEITSDEFDSKKNLDTLEGKIYQNIYTELSPKKVQENIIANFPKPEIHRRNTGYAIDELIHSDVFTDTSTPFNMCSLLSGSEGTLAFTTEITLQLDDLPPQESLMIAAHFRTIDDCMNAVAPIMEHTLFTCEMMDKTILDCTKNNIEQFKNRFFIVDDPEAILMLELRSDNLENLEDQEKTLLQTLENSKLSYANPVLKGKEIDQALELRKAGLGLLGNIVGDKKAVACIEDTAVAIPDLANYIKEFTEIMKSYDQDAVYYAHAGAGEIHLRPILDLKKNEDVQLFKKITDDVAVLVKKYQGSMSGEHGDGIVRAGYIPYMIGEENYKILERVKQTFDPHCIFNPGKIVDAFPMDQKLRYVIDREEPKIDTLLDFSDSMGILRAAEKCNGSGDCRKSVEAGGTMCPSYRATKNEKDTTRGRANALREFLTNEEKPNRFNTKELKEVFDLCLSCKGCSSECPSNVDVATLKAEFEYQYQKENGISLRTKLFAYNNRLNSLGSIAPGLANFFFRNKVTSGILKSSLGVAKKRNLPELSDLSLRKWYKNNLKNLQPENPIKTIYFFVDEFTNHLDTQIGIDAIELLVALNYEVKIVGHKESGRTFISKGLLKQAKGLANHNIKVFKDLITTETPLIGLEPSAILTFRDEYLRLADDRDIATVLASNVFMVDEFLKSEIERGNISSDQFTKEEKTIKLHGHCHQKALSNIQTTFVYLNLPENFKVTIIPSGCCGMAGSFGYEKEHYEISMKIGEQTLFPSVRKAALDVVIAAVGTSCRHQIKDGTQRNALHPISILRSSLIG
ncbi:FAD-binding and (Fe-S)-binding domain-containing protein [Aquimarina sp. 2201CG5-10]|uniref:FAD-binding and (Fe-S)-binding domain-containing protein n=1 Tax=Aquimarina callyspongiae TaxID=3098150 RepID=UPI002AB3B666|nr:FAD-linked oxidase C-terminal domain-containing protein [Aquimarina sp. 2201CG5-10]MDY8135781.1 FAD-linked oxidase C-terminal domain-containing protein [Aquimarina sp. 2201CG5-10]